MPAQKNNNSTPESTLSGEPTRFGKPEKETEGERASVVRPEPLRVLLTWKAPIRPFKKRSREYFSTIGAIVFLVGVILLFLQEWFLIAVIVALVFVAYIMATIPPEEVEHRITNRGIVTGGKTYRWERLGRFWLDEKLGKKILYFENMAGFPGRLTFLLGETPPEQVREMLSEYLLSEEPEETWADKASQWLSQRIPLEKVD